MKVIFLQHVQNIAQKGDVKNVSEGYARNFLFPKKLADIATTERLALANSQKQQQAIHHDAENFRFQEIASKLKNEIIKINAKAHDDGGLFGSVGAQEISSAMRKQGFDVAPSHVQLPKPLKKLGEYVVVLKFNQEIKGEVRVNIEAEK
ncbi:MAG: 50S ribosomal protein L9 [Candidatus Spechtbacteria bacterium]|nr:50S ribosomal protein L9 [Candidatus Spechtbacteria bacterium]